MNTTRFNIFNQIHKGLRALMFDTALLLQHTDFGLADQAQPVLEQVQLLLSMFEAHGYHEDKCILETASVYDPMLTKSFEDEHVCDLELSQRISELIAAYQETADAVERKQTGSELMYALNDFIAFNLVHMNKEETELNVVLWQHYSDEELLGMENRIQALVPPEKQLIYFKWMIRGINDQELIGWITAVRNGAPEFVLEALLHQCRENITEERWLEVASLVPEIQKSYTV